MRRFDFQTAKTISDTRSRPAARCARALHELFRPMRAWGTPGAHGTRSRACSVVVVTRVSHHEYPDHPAFPHTMVLRFTPRSPRRRIRLVTVIDGYGLSKPGWADTPPPT